MDGAIGILYHKLPIGTVKKLFGTSPCELYICSFPRSLTKANSTFLTVHPRGVTQRITCLSPRTGRIPREFSSPPSKPANSIHRWAVARFPFLKSYKGSPQFSETWFWRLWLGKCDLCFWCRRRYSHPHASSQSSFFAPLRDSFIQQLAKGFL